VDVGKDEYVKKSPIALSVVSCDCLKYQRRMTKFRKPSDNYIASVEFIHNPPQGVRITEIAPPSAIATGRTTKNEAPLRTAYETGTDYGNRFIHSLVASRNNK
jgi:predicted patatin/cPLA2 family phospholipase